MSFDEYTDPHEGFKVVENGDYLCVQCWEHPVHVYKLVPPGKELHRSIARTEYNGRVYGLAWIEDEKE